METQMTYVYPKAAELQDKPMVGTHQCVALVQEYAGAPAWVGKESGTITKRYIKSLGRDKKGSFTRPSNNADAFSVID